MEWIRDTHELMQHFSLNLLSWRFWTLYTGEQMNPGICLPLKRAWATPYNQFFADQHWFNRSHFWHLTSRELNEMGISKSKCPESLFNLLFGPMLIQLINLWKKKKWSFNIRWLWSLIIFAMSTRLINKNLDIWIAGHTIHYSHIHCWGEIQWQGMAVIWHPLVEQWMILTR